MLTAWVWVIQQSGAPMDNPSPAVWLGVVGPVLALTAAIVGKVSYDKGKAAAVRPSTDALVERQEGAFQERVGAMLNRLSDTISAGNAAHRDELRVVSASMRDAAQAMRAVVDEVAKHSEEARPAFQASTAVLPLVQDIHGHTIPKRRRGRR